MLFALYLPRSSCSQLPSPTVQQRPIHLQPTGRCWCRIATLREAFRNTPTWLGFNIELKYPTEAQLAAMPTRFYSRNYFCDSILKVTPLLLRSACPTPSLQCFMVMAVKPEYSPTAVAID